MTTRSLPSSHSSYKHCNQNNYMIYAMWCQQQRADKTERHCKPKLLQPGHRNKRMRRKAGKDLDEQIWEQNPGAFSVVFCSKCDFLLGDEKRSDVVIRHLAKLPGKANCSMKTKTTKIMSCFDLLKPLQTANLRQLERFADHWSEDQAKTHD